MRFPEDLGMRAFRIVNEECCESNEKFDNGKSINDVAVGLCCRRSPRESAIVAWDPECYVKVTRTACQKVRTADDKIHEVLVEVGDKNFVDIVDEMKGFVGK
jgi:hypothetical protein